MRNGPRADEQGNLAEALEHGYTLPANWYTNPAFFALERRHVFRRTWHYVGHLEQVKQPGQYFTTRIDNVPIIVVRDEARQLRGFINVCRHRGSEIVLDRAGQRKTLQCHYHGWTWDLNGRLRAAPRSNEQPNFSCDDFPLLTVRLETFGPYIFANLDPDAAPLAQTLGELPQILAEAGVRPGELALRERRTYEIEANWKIVVENYLECYHCPIAHPSFSSIIDIDRYVTIPYEHFSVQRGALRSTTPNEGPELYGPADATSAGIYVYLWPNFMLNSYPGSGMISLNLMVPVDVNRTTAMYELYFAEEFSEREIAEMLDFIDQVQHEDTRLCESVQRGLSSGYYRQGQLILARENGVQHFQQLLYRTLVQSRSDLQQ